jgi:hypothetical protein
LTGTRAIYHNGWWAGTRHGMDGVTVANTEVVPFAKHVWELYDMRSDFGHATDLSAEYPAKLAEPRRRGTTARSCLSRSTSRRMEVPRLARRSHSASTTSKPRTDGRSTPVLNFSMNQSLSRGVVPPAIAIPTGTSSNSQHRADRAGHGFESRLRLHKTLGVAFACSSTVDYVP